MNLETTFYIFGIVTMSLNLLLLLAVVILLFYIKKKMTEIMQQVDEKIQTVKYVMQHPGEMAGSIGAAVATSALERVVNLVKERKKKS